MRPVVKLLLAAIGLLGCFLFGFSWRDIQRGEPPSTRALDALVGVKVTPAKLTPEQVFEKNYNRILVDYSRHVDPTDLKYAGMEGMMASLGDPHTIFMPPKDAEAFSDETRANFSGIGAKLMTEPTGLGAKVATVFDDGPAYAAGLRAGNIITAVNGVSVADKEIDSIVDRIKGKEGTVVKLTVIQEGKTKPVILAVRRARIVTPTVEGKYLPDSKMGYLAIYSFSEPTAEQFDKELRKLEQHELTGLVIDLRGNPGGLLETAKALLGRFVENKVVVTMRFRDGDEETERTPTGELHNFRYPIAVLINEDSASAAEIFAGGLKDYGKVTLVGEHSYGKASVQNVFPLVDQASAKITIAKYFLPSGRFIGRKVDEDGVFLTGGLEPDVKVALTEDMQVEPGDPATDNQLRKAIEVLQAKAAH